jgi:hypothetical protein
MDDDELAGPLGTMLVDTMAGEMIDLGWVEPLDIPPGVVGILELPLR